MEPVDRSEFLELLGPFLDGDLSDVDRARMERAIAEDEACQREWAAFQAADRVVRERTPSDDPDPAYWPELERAVLERTEKLPLPGVARRTPSVSARFFASPRVRLYGALAAAAALVLIGLWAGPHRIGDMGAFPETAVERVQPSASPTLSAAPEKDADAPGPPAQAAPSEGRRVARRDTASIAAVALTPAPPASEASGGYAASTEVVRTVGAGAPARPARGGLQALTDARMAEERARLQHDFARSSDSLDRSLRREEIHLRLRLEQETDSAMTAQLNRELADVLYRLAERTMDRHSIQRALYHWRAHYDLMAHELGDSTVKARVRRLESSLNASRPEPRAEAEPATEAR